MHRKEILTGAAGALAAGAVVLAAPFAAADQAPPVNAAPVRPPAGATAPPSFADVVERVAPAVVSIEVEGRTADRIRSPRRGRPPSLDPFEGLPFDLRRFFPQFRDAPPRPMRGAASGFFISADGYILTNNHVVDGAQKITVRTPDERDLDATVVGRDPATDLAVLKVQGRDFPFVNLDQGARPRVGDWVVAVGNPFGLGGTATAGIVSAISRANISGSSYVDYLQIDAPINRGNSGGPTFDARGRLVGVNTAIFSPSGGSVGIGFDIPAEVAASVARDLIRSGKVVRGYIGATVQDVTPELAQGLGVTAREGALIADVEPGGPSDRAGLRSGDIVLSVNGAPLRSATELTRRVAQVRPGETLRLTIRRDGRQQQLALTALERPAERELARSTPPGARGEAGPLGMRLSPNRGGGLRVDAVEPGSEAAQEGIRPGDVIEQVGGRTVNSTADVGAALAAVRATGRSQALVRVVRDGRGLYLALEAPGASG